MLTKKITSLQHPVIKHLLTLRKERKARAENGSVLITGRKMIEEIGSSFGIRRLVVLEGHDLLPHAQEVYIASLEILKKITGLQHPDPYAAEVFLPPQKSLKGKSPLLAIDGLSDPGNVGTLLRSALALGWQGAFILNESADPFNDKALRAAKGATFHLPLCFCTSADLEQFVLEEGLNVVVADVQGISLKDFVLKEPLLLILGNESKGSRFKGKFPKIKIPMHPDAESLNVAAAGAILMYQLGKK